MKKIFYLALSIVLISCSSDELSEPIVDDSSNARYIGTLPIPGADDVQLKMYFETERSVDGIDYAGIQFTSVHRHDKEIEIIVDYYHGSTHRVFVPQYFRIKANEIKSNKLWNVSAFDMFGTCAATYGLKTIRMKIREVKYDGVIINSYTTVPTSGNESNTFYTFCTFDSTEPLDYDYDGVDNDVDDCPYTHAGDDDDNEDGCPD